MKISRIYLFISAALFSFALLACGGGGDGGSTSTAAPATPSQLSQGLAEMGKSATVISNNNQQNQLAAALATAAYQSPVVTIASPAVQLETTLIHLSHPHPQ